MHYKYFSIILYCRNPGKQSQFNKKWKLYLCVCVCACVCQVKSWLSSNLKLKVRTVCRHWQYVI